VLGHRVERGCRVDLRTLIDSDLPSLGQKEVVLGSHHVELIDRAEVRNGVEFKRLDDLR
jgi:hypothetical protein